MNKKSALLVFLLHVPCSPYVNGIFVVECKSFHSPYSVGKLYVVYACMEWKKWFVWPMMKKEYQKHSLPHKCDLKIVLLTLCAVFRHLFTFYSIFGWGGGFGERFMVCLIWEKSSSYRNCMIKYLHTKSKSFIAYEDQQWNWKS